MNARMLAAFTACCALGLFSLHPVAAQEPPEPGEVVPAAVAPAAEPPAPLLSESFWKHYDDGLSALDLSRSDSGFDKRVAGDAHFELPAFKRSMEAPETLPAEAQRIVDSDYDPMTDAARPIVGDDPTPQKFFSDLLAATGAASFEAAWNEQIKGTLPEWISRFPEGESREYAIGTLYLLALHLRGGDAGFVPVGVADRAFNNVRDSLPGTLLETVNGQLVGPGASKDDLLKTFGPGKTDTPVASDQFGQAYMAKLMDIGSSWQRNAGLLQRFLYEQHQALGESLIGKDEVLRATLTIGVDNYPAPLLVLAGTGDHKHEFTHSPVLCVDFGGNDLYRGAVAVARAGSTHFSALFDLGDGNDRYESAKLEGMEFESIGPCATIGGCTLLQDMGGNDTYIGSDISCCAAIAGVAVLADLSGSDRYVSRQFGQAAAFVGYAAISDFGVDAKLGDDSLVANSNDSYTIGRYGQGFGFTLGYGRLEDSGGNDTYRAGGLYRHMPLLPDRYQSMSQGFGWGMRNYNLGGGVGMIIDRGIGNDVYDADVYAQGASYWYALGICWDEGGNDHYIMGQYGQGAGIHLSAGILVDKGGHDTYANFNGVGTGGAHDYAIGWLLDLGKGDDSYYSNGLAQGLNNSVAVLYDEGGDDCYASRADVGIGFGQNNSIALLIDGAGNDRYTQPAANGLPYRRGRTGLVLDLLGEGEKPQRSMPARMDRLDGALPPLEPASDAKEAAPPATPTIKQAGSEPMPEDAGDLLDQLWRKACEWEVGTPDHIAEIRAARDRLVALGALDFLISKLGETNTLYLRCLWNTIPHFGEEAVAKLLPVAEAGDSQPTEARNAIDMIARTWSLWQRAGEAADASRAAYAEAAQRMLDRSTARLLASLDGLPRDRQIGAIDSLLTFGDKLDLSERIIGFTGDQRDRARKAAVEMLARVPASEAVRTALVAALSDRYYAVREAALSSLRKQQQSLTQENLMLESGEAPQQITLRALMPQPVAGTSAFERAHILALNAWSVSLENTIANRDAGRVGKLACLAAWHDMVSLTPIQTGDELAEGFPTYLFPTLIDPLLAANSDPYVLSQLYELRRVLDDRQRARDARRAASAGR